MPCPLNLGQNYSELRFYYAVLLRAKLANPLQHLVVETEGIINSLILISIQIRTAICPQSTHVTNQ